MAHCLGAPALLKGVRQLRQSARRHRRTTKRMAGEVEFTGSRLAIVLVCLAAIAGCIPPEATRLSTATTSAATDYTRAQVPRQASDAGVESPARAAEPAPRPVRAEPEATIAPVAATPGDVWATVRAGFAMRDVAPAHYAAELAEYARRADEIEIIAQRAEPFLHLILTEIAERGLPTELALLPVIESAYDPTARSHKAAAGLWQFMPATGRLFGLERNLWYDARYDVLASTQAALDYLEQLAQRFDGDWLLALAAYNAGHGRVSRAIARNVRAGQPTDFWSLSLPRETRRYVPKFLAMRAIVASPGAFAVDLPPIANRSVVQPVHLSEQIDLAFAADTLGLERAELQRLNPAYRYGLTLPKGGSVVLVPAQHAEVFQHRLADILDTQQLWSYHTVATGETLSHLAMRYRTSVAVLREMNGLAGDLIRAGRPLRVPTRGHEADGPTVMPVSAHPTPTRTRKVEHRVRRGESLWAIAKLYGVTVSELASWNELAQDTHLKIGKVLIVYAPLQGYEQA